MARTRRFANEPLAMLLESLRALRPDLHAAAVPQQRRVHARAGREPLHPVSHASNFTWRESHFRDLIGLMGDGLLTIDGEFHRRSRRIMLPAFHREHIAASFEAIVAGDRARAGRARSRARRSRPLRLDAAPGDARRDARAVRRGSRRRAAPARSTRPALFEEALAFYASEYFLRVLRGRCTPWARMQQAARKLDTLIYSEISRAARDRRARQRHPQPAARRPRRGRQHAQRPADPRRGDDAAVRRPRHDDLDRLVHVLRARPPTADRRAAARRAGRRAARRRAPERRAADVSGELAELEMVLDETLRKYPPAWVGPRRAIEPFEFEGHTVPARAFVNYCSWASHHLPDVFEQPEEFRPERFAPEAERGAAEGRLRALRRRLAHVHRHALRPARGAHDRHADPLALHALAARRLPARASARCRRSAPSRACRCVVQARRAASVPRQLAHRASAQRLQPPPERRSAQARAHASAGSRGCLARRRSRPRPPRTRADRRTASAAALHEQAQRVHDELAFARFRDRVDRRAEPEQPAARLHFDLARLRCAAAARRSLPAAPPSRPLRSRSACARQRAAALAQDARR